MGTTTTNTMTMLLGLASASGACNATHGSERVHPRPIYVSAGDSVAKARLEIVAIPTQEAEDGHGHVVAKPPAPRALDLHARGWPGRALDPVLSIGELRFRRYSFPERGVMRFWVDDVARLRAGQEASVQWGDDPSSRIVLTRSLVVPR